jgi:hypothetical protein
VSAICKRNPAKRFGSALSGVAATLFDPRIKLAEISRGFLDHFYVLPYKQNHLATLAALLSFASNLRSQSHRYFPEINKWMALMAAKQRLLFCKKRRLRDMLSPSALSL